MKIPTNSTYDVTDVTNFSSDYTVEYNVIYDSSSVLIFDNLSIKQNHWKEYKGNSGKWEWLIEGIINTEEPHPELQGIIVFDYNKYFVKLPSKYDISVEISNKKNANISDSRDLEGGIIINSYLTDGISERNARGIKFAFHDSKAYWFVPNDDKLITFNYSLKKDDYNKLKLSVNENFVKITINNIYLGEIDINQNFECFEDERYDCIGLVSSGNCYFKNFEFIGYLN